MKALKIQLYLFMAVLVMLASCDRPLAVTGEETVDGLEAYEMAKPGDTGDTKAGNNLSFPVIFSDGVVKPLRGTFGAPKFEGAFFIVNEMDWYVQNDLLNEWQAESVNAVTETGYESPVEVSVIDWGDNLEAKAWPYGAQVRVETVLYKTLTDPMLGYTMLIEDPNQSGLTEVWGTNTVTYNSEEATIYSGTAKLVIQKLLKDRNDPELNLTWDPDLSQWIGDAGEPLFEGGVWQQVDGPAGYSAEINVQGKLIYGYNWVTRKTAAGAGDYRLTFALDTNSPVTYNTAITSDTIIKTSEEDIVIQEEPDLGGGVADIDAENNLTYIDVTLTLKNGSGKPGGGQGKGQGGGGGGGKPTNAGNGGQGGGNGQGNH